MPTRNRPLSPHLSVYRWQIGNSLSILHRFTGAALALGLLALAFWLISIAGGEASYQSAARAFASPIGVLLLIGWTFAFFYHLFNGLRHLFWDVGLGFERRARHASGWLALLGACAATVCVWAFLWGSRP
ncbi:MAG TPA: succinate dehydrogenase, cytochrome b556 subunit [Steroidobacteraceae bacterium]|nr:succinate dehydrogenase, cytochrome b556 subunit [Steroidobacteraceae bacterium]